MTGEKRGSSGEFKAEMAFLAVLLDARKKANEAVTKGQKLPISEADLKYFLVWSHPELPHPMMTFLLTRDYDEMTAGKSETLRVSLPIEEIDFEQPVPATDDDSEYFMASIAGDNQELIIRLDVFADNIAGSNGSIPDLGEKIRDYTVVAIGQVTQPLDD